MGRSVKNLKFAVQTIMAGGPEVGDTGRMPSAGLPTAAGDSPPHPRRDEFLALVKFLSTKPESLH